MPTGFAYLVALLDIASRYIIAWRLSNSLDSRFCLEMLDEAFSCSRPLILNTDQGCQFTSNAWIQKVESKGVLVSQDGKGRWADNVYIERFWRTLKHEFLCFMVPGNLDALRQEMTGFITMYNKKRLHQALGYHTPFEVYQKATQN